MEIQLASMILFLFNFAGYFPRFTHELLHFYKRMLGVCTFFLLNLVFMLKAISLNILSFFGEEHLGGSLFVAIILGHIGFSHDYLFRFSSLIYPINSATAWRNTFIILYIILQKSIRITYIQVFGGYG